MLSQRHPYAINYCFIVVRKSNVENRCLSSTHQRSTLYTLAMRVDLLMTCTWERSFFRARIDVRGSGRDEFMSLWSSTWHWNSIMLLSTFDTNRQNCNKNSIGTQEHDELEKVDEFDARR